FTVVDPSAGPRLRRTHLYSLPKIYFTTPYSNVKVTLPFAVDSETHGKHLTYLDTTGRYAVVLEKHNVVDEHAQNFQITYEYQPLALLQKPLAASAAFFALFIVSAILSRVELRIAGKVR
ncbi:Ribophorin I-domain-containing protein, partial [Jimgerdemannia flammicorona]